MSADKQVIRQSPAWYRWLNGVWNRIPPRGTNILLEKDDLIRRARKRTGLHDLGSGFNDTPLEKLLWSINHEAGLHPAGRWITRQRMESLLSIRLRAEYLFRKYPQILDQELYPAWIIVGLQRTGTTKLQRLLANDPDHRVIPSWEVINPIPHDLTLYHACLDSAITSHHPRPTTHDPRLTTHPAYPHPADKRIAIAKTSVNALKYLSPGFFSIHPIDAMQPEEDILLLDVSFLSTTPEATMHVPTYAAWLETADQSEAYAYAVKLLKLLQRLRPAKRWVLKSPHHLEFPDLIEKHFSGGVEFLWPHRDLRESVPSFLSMVMANRLIFSDKVTENQVAKHWVRKIGYMLDCAMTFRERHPGHTRFTDIDYRKLVAEPLNELEKVYRLDGGLTPELKEAFLRHEREHPHRKHGIHSYSLDQFGITGDELAHLSLKYKTLIDRYLG